MIYGARDAAYTICNSPGENPIMVGSEMHARRGEFANEALIDFSQIRANIDDPKKFSLRQYLPFQNHVSAAKSITFDLIIRKG